MTRSQAITLKGMTTAELYRIYRSQGMTAQLALTWAKCKRILAGEVLTKGSFINHFNKYHNI
jgi:hypothetical protein